jgi:enoyl-CoA hydratase/carnithine racemase
MGLINKVLPANELLGYARAQAEKLTRLPASSLRRTKNLMKAAQAEIVKEKMMEENKYFGAMLLSPEAKEAFSAFFEKRKPDLTKFK